MENNFFKSQTFKGILIGIGAMTVILLSFLAGSAIGYKKAVFSYKFGDNYHNIFDGRPQAKRAPDFGFPPEGLAVAHGAIGSVIKIELPSIAVETPEGVEKAITIGDKTIIKKFRDDVKPSDLKMEDAIVVMGTPNENGIIEAKLIRIMPDQNFLKLRK